MSSAYRFDARALKELPRLDQQAQRDIIAYLDERIIGDGDPRHDGKGTQGRFVGVVALSRRQ